MEAPSNPGTNLDAHKDAGSDAEARGGDHRETQDNGTGNRGFNVQGANTIGEHPNIRDPHAPPGPPGDFYQSDQGLANNDVGHAGGVQDYGLSKG
jgi:hypothetical protein